VRYKSVTLVINRNDIKTIATYTNAIIIVQRTEFNDSAVYYFLYACFNLKKNLALIKIFIKYTYPILLLRFPRAKISRGNFQTNAALNCR